MGFIEIVNLKVRAGGYVFSKIMTKCLLKQ